MKKKDIIIALVEANLAERAQALEANQGLQRMLSQLNDALTNEREIHHEVRVRMRSEIEELKIKLQNARQGEPK